jgi:FSR family fosmidomycin resistance protein-like MFS transporter
LTTTQATLSPATPYPNETWLIATISAAHFASHYFLLLLPPLFLFVLTDYNVTYTEVGLALVVFNVVTGVLQTPAGFLVDRIGARVLLVAGLILEAAAFAVIGLVPSFWLFVAMFGVAGLANTVYHPADYAILSHRISPKRMGQAFSIHTFAGILGGAAAPVSLLVLQDIVGWRGAFLVAAAFGFAIAAVVAIPCDMGTDHPGHKKPVESDGAATGPTGWRLLLSPPILGNLLFFMLLSLANAGLQNYSVVALDALYGTPVKTATTALSAFMLTGAVGVLAGGVVASWTSRHSYVAVVGLTASAIVALIIGLYDLSPIALIAVMSIGGFFGGMIMPSRDLIVREVTPPGSFGKVFGFVTTGFNISGIIAPLIFGAIMDHGMPRAVFYFVAIGSIVSLLTVVSIPKWKPR